jgi:hypothetical protein
MLSEADIILQPALLSSFPRWKSTIPLQTRQARANSLEAISKTVCVMLNLSRFPDPAHKRDLPLFGFRSGSGILRSGT